MGSALLGRPPWVVFAYVDHGLAAGLGTAVRGGRGSASPSSSGCGTVRSMGGRSRRGPGLAAPDRQPVAARREPALATRETPPEQAWCCVFGERVPSGAQVSVVFSNPTGEQVPGRVAYVGELFWATEVRGLHPQAAVVVGETHQSCDLRLFDQRPRGTGWFRPHGVDGVSPRSPKRGNAGPGPDNALPLGAVGGSVSGTYGAARPRPRATMASWSRNCRHPWRCPVASGWGRPLCEIVTVVPPAAACKRTSRRLAPGGSRSEPA